MESKNLKIDVEETGQLTRELRVEIPAEIVQAEMNRELANVQRETTLKGFRKGKAPLNMIERAYGDRVKAEVVDKLIKDSLPDAVTKSQLKVACRPTLTAADFTDDGAFAYSTTVELLPEIDRVYYDNLKLETVEPEVSDQEIDEIVEHYRKQLSDLRPVDRPATQDDIIIADLEKIADPKMVLKTNQFSDSHIDLANPLTVKEFREQFPGAKADDVKEIDVVYDNDYADPAFAGARITYRCHVKSVNERILPEFNDEFAKRTGVAETALELRLKIRQDQENNQREAQKRVHKREIIRQVSDMNDLQIPEGMINDYLDVVVEDTKKQYKEIDETQIRDTYRPIGEQAIRWDILWHKLAQQKKIEVLPSDTEKWINDVSTQNNMTVEQAKEALNKSGRIAELKESILEQKVFDSLIEAAEKVPAQK